ncbi:xylan glycosyltransferase MUCI21-like isoform X2 [Prosopis cineraria]|uniref:xylan glycosyltransferase MUCI21-like isoform X2 n=1 Tax=Prosopis cineraria TaxID=364024 RepID=UPI00240EC3EA|nr:xylan glycosyltransferase MUCI21-like isoform X2 [Prosopis cineraria]
MMNCDQKKMKGQCSVSSRLTMVGLLFLISILITAQMIKLSALSSINIFAPSSSSSSSSSPSSSSSADLSKSLSNNYSATSSRNQPPQVVDPTTGTFFVMGPNGSDKPKIVEKIKPYPRKFEDFIMAQIKNITLISGPQSPPCKVHHIVPALVFSVGGYTGNFFHDFTDGFIPLFITINTIFHDHQGFVIVISEGPDWWPTKYANLLNIFTKHPIITLKNETQTHCFPYAHVGLISHGFMTINHTLLPTLKTYLHFRNTLHEAYNSHHDSSMSPKKPISQPRLVFASRKGTTGRMILNQRKAIQVMKEVGFDVVVFEPKKNTSLRESYALVSSCHALIGVHGAALTHSLFLRPGSMLMQIVPIGVEWAAKAFFGSIVKGLKLEYMEYRIKVKESSLVRKYGRDSLMLRNPFALQKNGWPIELMNIYLKEQNVKLDLVRFRGYLEEAYKKAYKFMQEEEGVS